MTLRLETNATSAEEWDAFVRQAEGGTACHWAGWRGVLESVFGHEGHFLSARGPDGSLEGILPLVRVRSLLFGRYLVSMPFLSYGGPLGSAAAVRALAGRAAEIAGGEKVKRLELRSRVALPLDMPVSHRKITVVLDLAPGDPEAVFKGLGSKVRSQVRRPAKEGVEVRFGRDQVAPFHRVFARHMRDLGTPAMPRRWFEAIADAFGDGVARSSRPGSSCASAWCGWHRIGRARP